MKTYSFKINDFTHNTKQNLKKHTLNTINPTTLLICLNRIQPLNSKSYVFQSKNKLLAYLQKFYFVITAFI